ncbi:MAG: hypothetical protein ACMG6H_16040, partial [Acidobacteriota bacterium]
MPWANPASNTDAPLAALRPVGEVPVILLCWASASAQRERRSMVKLMEPERSCHCCGIKFT